MTKTILHIDASARNDGSVTRELTALIVEKLGAGHIIRRDLNDGITLLNETAVSANFTPIEARTPEQVQSLALSDILVAELRAAETIVIGAPMYNFGIPAALKAWVDLVCRRGETFHYEATGPVGHLTNKRVILAVATGGVPVGSEVDFVTSYMKCVLAFLGMNDVELITSDLGFSRGADALDAAKKQIEALSV